MLHCSLGFGVVKSEKLFTPKHHVLGESGQACPFDWTAEHCKIVFAQYGTVEDITTFFLKSGVQGGDDSQKSIVFGIHTQSHEV